MSNNLKSIEFVFENCEHMSFPGNVIGELDIDDIKRHICRVAVNAFQDYYASGHVFVEIFTEGNTDYYPFGVETNKQKKFDRLLAYNDITSVEIELDGERKETFLVNYNTGLAEDEPDLGADNQNQKVFLSELGNLYILIDAKKMMEDVISIERANDVQEMTFRKDMYDVGVEEYPVESLNSENLPDFYRYVVLTEKSSSGLELSATAVRVPDAKMGWKFVFEDEVLHFPSTWQYYNDKLSDFIDSNRDEFTMEKIRNLYPMI